MNYYHGANITTSISLPALPATTLAQFYLVDDLAGAITITLPDPSTALNGCVVQFRRYLHELHVITFITDLGGHIVPYTSSAVAATTLSVIERSTTFICGNLYWFQMQTV